MKAGRLKVRPFWLAEAAPRTRSRLLAPKTSSTTGKANAEAKRTGLSRTSFGCCYTLGEQWPLDAWPSLLRDRRVGNHVAAYREDDKGSALGAVEQAQRCSAGQNTTTTTSSRTIKRAMVSPPILGRRLVTVHQRSEGQPSEIRGSRVFCRTNFRETGILAPPAAALKRCCLVHRASAKASLVVVTLVRQSKQRVLGDSRQAQLR